MIDLVTHGSESTFGNAATLALWHGLPKPRGRGWKTIGYHFVILNGWLAKGVYNKFWNGHIETGRPLDDDPFLKRNERGAHVRGRNHDTLSVCMIGESGQYTDEQYESLMKVAYMIDCQFDGVRIMQHTFYDARKPQCAGINIHLIRNNYELYKASMNQ